MAKDDEVFMYEDDELEQIEKLEKLDEKKLMARLVFELNKFNMQYENNHIPNMQKISLYMDEMSDLKEDEIIPFDEWERQRRNSLLSVENDEFRKRRELQEKINKNWNRMRDDVDKFNKNAHDKALNEAIRIIKNEFDWDNLPSKSQIKVKLRALNIQVEYKDWIHGEDLAEYKTVNDCPTKCRPLPLTELEVCFYKAQK